MTQDINIQHYDSPNSGPHLVITGAIHGNEPCGPKAIKRLQGAIDNGDIQITRGQLTLVPVCNPAAYEQDTRYYQRNMNRHFYPKDTADTYEDRLINELTPHLAKADYLLDLHSYTSGGTPFVFVDTDGAEDRRFARMLGIRETICGFTQAYENAGVAQSQWTSMGTTEYVRRQGGCALTLECGQHYDPQSVDIAWRAILGVLHHLSLAAITGDMRGDIPAMADAADMACTEAVKVVYKDRPAHFTRDWGHLQAVTKDTVIAEYEDGEQLRVPGENMRLIMPKDSAPVGEEWLYFGRSVQFEA